MAQGGDAVRDRVEAAVHSLQSDLLVGGPC